MTTVGEIVAQVCEDLVAANEVATTVGYSSWSSSNDGDGYMILETYDEKTGDVTGTYTLKLQVKE